MIYFWANFFLFQARNRSNANTKAVIVASRTPQIGRNTPMSTPRTSLTTAEWPAATNPTPIPPPSGSTWKCTDARAARHLITTATARSLTPRQRAASPSQPVHKLVQSLGIKCRGLPRWENGMWVVSQHLPQRIPWRDSDILEIFTTAVRQRPTDCEIIETVCFCYCAMSTDVLVTPVLMCCVYFVQSAV